ncbi:MAG: class I SAM-dependent methyltransferase [Pseudomonadales bacterium]|nr:class I SAM-dependent methyltransferase [Pseudomonadales bacterium]
MSTGQLDSNVPDDRQRWDARYRADAYAKRHWPSAYLQQLHQEGVIADSGRALDVACGRGRNSLFLASQGLRVDALDVSSVAIAQAANTAISQRLRVNWQCSDVLKHGHRLPQNTYALVIMFRFVAPQLLPRLLQTLTPAGVLVVEEHLQWGGAEDLSGPSSNRFRVAAGDLFQQLQAAQVGFDVVDQFEGLIPEPANDGMSARAAVSRMCIRRS